MGIDPNNHRLGQLPTLPRPIDLNSQTHQHNNIGNISSTVVKSTVDHQLLAKPRRENCTDHEVSDAGSCLEDNEYDSSFAHDQLPDLNLDLTMNIPLSLEPCYNNTDNNGNEEQKYGQDIPNEMRKDSLKVLDSVPTLPLFV